MTCCAITLLHSIAVIIKVFARKLGLSYIDNHRRVGKNVALVSCMFFIESRSINDTERQRWNRVSGSRVTGSPGQQFGSGSGRVTGQSSDPDFDPGSCSMPISHTLYSSTECGY